MEAETHKEIGPADGGRGLSPLKAFLVVAAIAGIGGLVWFLGGRDSSADPTTPPATTTTTNPTLLTEAEAKTEFKRLTRGLFSAVQSRDTGALAEYTMEGSPVYANARESIREHKRDNVIDRTRVEFDQIDVLSVTSDEIRLRARELLFPCFVSEDGEDVTTGARAFRRVGIWVLTSDGTHWLITDGQLEEARKVKSDKAGC